MSYIFHALITIFCLYFSSLRAAESGGGYLDDKFVINVGSFFPRLDSTLKLDSNNLIPSTTLNFERDLGMPKSNQSPWINISWRYKPRHMLTVEYLSMPRHGLVERAKEWNVRNTKITARGTVNSDFDLKFLKIDYNYFIVKDEKKEFGLVFGVHITRLNTYLAVSGELLINDVPVYVLPEVPVVESGTTKAPLPHFGLQFNYAFTPKLLGVVNGVGFSLSMDDYSARMYEANFALLYNFTAHFGVGVGYRGFYLKATEDKGKKFDMKADIKFSGPGLFISARF